MERYDAIVVGGGTMGSAAAWALATRGARTLVLEQFRHVHGRGSHGGQTRIIRHAYAESPEYVPLVLRADELWRELEDTVGTQVLHRTGGLEMSGPGGDHARSVRRSATEHGLPHEWLTPDEVRRRWPVWDIGDDWEACYTPGAGFLTTEPSLRSLRRAAERLGAVFREEEPVRAWEATLDAIDVRTDQGVYGAERLIVTAGAWAGSILTELGLPLTVLRKTLWWLAVADPTPFVPERFPVFIAESAEGDVYGFPLHDEPGLKVARHSGGEPFDPDATDRVARDEEKQEVVPFVRRRLRGVSDRVTSSAVCLYTVTPDHDFVVDRHPERLNVVIGAGFSGHGFKFTPAIGEELAALAFDPAHRPYPRLAIGRFAVAAPVG